MHPGHGKGIGSATARKESSAHVQATPSHAPLDLTTAPVAKSPQEQVQGMPLLCHLSPCTQAMAMGSDQPSAMLLGHGIVYLWFKNIQRTITPRTIAFQGSCHVCVHRPHPSHPIPRPVGLINSHNCHRSQNPPAKACSRNVPSASTSKPPHHTPP